MVYVRELLDGAEMVGVLVRAGDFEPSRKLAPITRPSNLKASKSMPQRSQTSMKPIPGELGVGLWTSRRAFC